MQRVVNAFLFHIKHLHYCELCGVVVSKKLLLVYKNVKHTNDIRRHRTRWKREYTLHSLYPHCILTEEELDGGKLIQYIRSVDVGPI